MQDSRLKTLRLFVTMAVCIFMTEVALGQTVKQNHPATDKHASAVGATTSSPQALQRPKLVVGIVVDQMRYDFLFRYYAKYGSGGFKRLMNGGYNCEQTYFNYMPTYTGPGHTSIYTGTTPALHGIIANNWFDRKSGKMVYCTQDDSMRTIGSTSNAGKMSPQRMQVTTVTDQLQLATNRQSKVIGIALKDRGAILPAGHSADAAYWLDDNAPVWITSSYYMNALPQWVNDFNAQNKAAAYISKSWETLNPLASYTESIADNNAYEQTLKGETSPTFPHDLPAIAKASTGSNAIRVSPFGNSLTTDFALATVDGEQMGKHSATDFLCVSYSSTDYVGHAFGPNSIETEDTYLRLDKDLERLLNGLDAKVGLNNVLIFLTADHGISEVPAYLQSLKIPSEVVNEAVLVRKVKSFCQSTFGDSLVASYSNQQFFFNDGAIARLKLNRHDASQRVADYARGLDEAFQVFTADDLLNNTYENMPAHNIQMGYSAQRSGDVVINYPPQDLDFATKGTTHGSPYNYDAHVPLIFFGWNVKPTHDYARVQIPDAAVTVSALLHILEPSGATGKVIQGIMR